MTDPSSIWHRPLNSRFPEDREAAEIGLLMERTSAAPLPTDGTHPNEASRDLEYGTDRVPLLPFDDRLVSVARAELTQGAFTWMLDRRLRDRRYDRTLLKHLREDRRLRPEQIERMVFGYRRKLIKFRLETYTRFAMMDALSAANHAQWAIAIAEGRYRVSEVRRYWIPVGSDDCERCAPITDIHFNGVGFTESFQTPLDGSIYRPPLCPRCRCTVWIQWEDPTLPPPSPPGGHRYVFNERVD